ERYNDVRGIIHHDETRNGQRLFDMTLIGGQIFGIDGKDRHPMRYQRSADIVTCRKRVGSTEGNLRTSGLQRGKQHSGLGGNMQRGSNTVSLKGLVRSKFLGDLSKHRHMTGSPGDALLPGPGKGEIVNVMWHQVLSFLLPSGK